jgi:DNA-binding XRE family transcriptional regulator
MPNRQKSNTKDTKYTPKGHEIMWRDNIIEAKNKKGISTAEMARRSKIGLTEKTISRSLTGKTTPDLETVFDMGETVGLTPQQIFADTSCLVADPKLIEDMRFEIESLRLERQMLTDENKALRHQNETLKDELLELFREKLRKDDSAS